MRRSAFCCLLSLLVILQPSLTWGSPPKEQGRATGGGRDAPPVASPGSGGSNTVAVLETAFEGDVSEGTRRLFASRLVEGLTAASFEVLSGVVVRDALTAAGSTVDGACQDASCYPRVAKTLGVRYLVRARISAHFKDYEMALELINGQTGAAVALRRERCDICGVEEASEKLALAVADLRKRLEALVRAPAHLVIRSRPSGAAVHIDDRPVGHTPVDLELAPGPHRLRISAAGHEATERSLTAVSGVHESLEVQLLALPTPFPYKAVGWSGLGAGVLALAAGIVALAVDGNEISCSAQEKDPAGRCPYLRKTDVLGAVLLGLGGALTVGGGVSLYLGSVGGVAGAAGSGEPRPGLGASLPWP